MKNENQIRPCLSRRECLVRMGKAGGALFFLWAAGFWLRKRGAALPSDTAEGVSWPDFSVPGLSGKLVAVTSGERAKALERALQALGGIEKFIRPGDRVLLKVNAAFASPPLIGATTHPELLAEMIRLCRKAGADQVLVADNPINDPAACFALTGMEAAVKAAGGRLVLPRASDFKPLLLPGAERLAGWPVFYEPFKNINKLIGLAPLKDHHRSGASMTMKNWYGLLGGRRNILHQDIHQTILELARMIKPTLVVLDGTTAMMQNGPTGGSLADLKQADTLIVSTDQVAADALGASILEKDMQTLGFIRLAEAAAVGTADYRSLNPIFLSV